MVNLGLDSIVAITSGNIGDLGLVPNSRISAPAKNVRPLQTRIMASIWESADAFWKPSTMDFRTSYPSAFTGGESIVKTAMPSCTSYFSKLVIERINLSLCYLVS